MKNIWCLAAKNVVFSVLLSAIFSIPTYAEEILPTPVSQELPTPSVITIERPTSEDFFAEEIVVPAVETQTFEPAGEEPAPAPAGTSNKKILLWGFVLAVVLGSLASKGGQKTSSKNASTVKNTTVTKEYDGDI